MSGALKGGHS